MLSCFGLDSHDRQYGHDYVFESHDKKKMLSGVYGIKALPRLIRLREEKYPIAKAIHDVIADGKGDVGHLGEAIALVKPVRAEVFGIDRKLHLVRAARGQFGHRPVHQLRADPLPRRPGGGVELPELHAPRPARVFGHARLEPDLGEPDHHTVGFGQSVDLLRIGHVKGDPGL